MFRLVLFTIIFTSLKALARSDCDFSQIVKPGRKYYVYSPGYPGNYTAGSQCRWIAFCPEEYNCRLHCTEVVLPKSRSCLKDYLLVSRTGDPQLDSADVYCGSGQIEVVSTDQTLSVGLISSRFSSGGRFMCELIAIKAIVSTTCQCGYKNKIGQVRMTRIVDGEETNINEYPLMAGLVDLNIEMIICGATIISHRHLLTAAHCAMRPKERLGVVVGEHNTEMDDSPFTRAYKVMKVIVHPNFKPDIFDYDIAVVQIAGRMLFNEGVGPVCLPFKFVNKNITGEYVTIIGENTETTAYVTNYLVERLIIHQGFELSNFQYEVTLVRVTTNILFGVRVAPAYLPFKFVNTDLTRKTVTMLGWGTTAMGKKMSKYLQKVDVPVISQSSCRPHVPMLTSRQFCTYRDGKDSCQGDSGGPVLYTDPETGRLYSVGIISCGKLCAERGQPGLNTYVPSLLNWITSNTPGETYCRM